MVDYSIEFSKQTGDQTLVSTDDPSLAHTFNVEYVHIRTEVTAAPHLTNFEVIREKSDDFEDYDYICLLQPTHPMRRCAITRLYS